MLALLSAASGKAILFPGVSVGEIILAAIVAIYALRSWMDPLRITLPGRQALFIFGLWVVVSGLVLYNSSAEFSASEFVKSFAKLLLYASAALVVGAIAARQPEGAVFRVVELFVIGNACVGLYVYIAMHFDGALPYRFLWALQDGPELSGYFRDTGLVRLRGSFSEPAHFGMFQCFGVAYLLHAHGGRQWVSRRTLVFTGLPLVLTFSLSTYVLAIFVYLPLVLRAGVRTRGRRRWVALGVVSVIGAAMIALATPVGDPLRIAVIQRVGSVAAGEDRSGVSRLYGSWELPLAIIKDSPFLGGGLGNVDVLYPRYSHSLQYRELLEGQQGWNVLAYVLGSTGLTGLAVFVGFLVALFVNNGKFATIFAVSLFATGGLLQPVLWVFYAVLFASTPGPSLGPRGRATSKTLERS